MLYAFREGIQQTLTTDRMYTLVAIGVANYVQVTRPGAGGVRATIAAAAVLVLAPVLFSTPCSAAVI